MTDAFAELVMPIFRRGIGLQERLAQGESRTVDEVKRMAGGWIEEARRRAMSSAGLKQSFEQAQFGLVAWIDEVLTESDWGRQAGLPEGILEWDIYGSRDRATLFYDHADRAEAEGSLDALEVYLVAVTLGFRGELVHDDGRLADWVHRVYGRVSGAGGVPDRPFAEDPAHHDRFAPLRGPSLLLAVSVLVSITALITLAAYLLAVHADYNAHHPNPTASRVIGLPGIHVGQAFRPDGIGSSGWKA
jgi:type VI secretion system protein ImpK